MKSFLLVVAALTTLSAGCGKRKAPPAAGAPVPGILMATPFYMPGIERPPTTPAAGAAIGADEEVIGVVVNGQARAYHVKALKSVNQHVINDLVNGSALSVTYCDRTDCARAFTEPDRKEPLPIAVGGYREGLLLRIGPDQFEQKTAKSVGGARQVPYRSTPHRRVKWGEWKRAHPKTDVYLGGGTATLRPPGS